ncbi:hypothetical protein JRQ81_004915 [Phrynocephalus forsythii]|uniref:Uncharacterized protein n=1 Tax=Phrynocephalus forsythii TaxID=171643 RepID=A0A9Q1B6L8_9SAUR|nr:hypothetical protein JRQ81_004915 [Phrynocephalus forsythii]
MVKYNIKKPIPARSSPGLTRTTMGVDEPGHPSINGLQVTGPIAEQPGHGPVELLEAEPSQKWQKYTLPENRTIMKCYYRAEPEKRGYQKRMHQLWKQEYPNSSITELRLPDQRRNIIRNKVFSKVELEEIQRSCEIGGQ